MNQQIPALMLLEEKRALKIYLLLFYIILVLYDVFYYFIYKIFVVYKAPGFESSLSYWSYVLFIGLIPISLYLSKKGKQDLIKYIYVLTYIIMSTALDIVVYLHNNSNYASGNAAELILVMFSPIFINKRFYWFVTIGPILRYLIVGLIINSLLVAIPIVLIIILSIVAYILLRRFSSYIHALTSAHEELRHREKLALVGQMATSIGHEIRNPLASLKGFTQLQREKYPDDKKYFSIMEQEIDRIDSIVDDLLIIGRPRSANFQKHSLKEIVDYIVSINRQVASEKDILLVSEVEGDVPDIECDENQIKQVCFNLVKNGIEAMQNGTMKIAMKVIPHNNISLSFIDQGCGIEGSEIEKLFEPFYTTKEDGTGLGLMVTKKIIEDHKGKIQIESEVNKGTKVEIILPITQ